MAIDLQIFKEASSGQQLQPTRTPVYSNPDATTGLEGITSMFKEQERLIEQQNDSNYAIQETKYLSERQKTINEIGEQVASGKLTDIQAKENVFKYDTEQENKYKTILPPTYHTRLNQRVQTEIAKTGASIDSLYKQTKDQEFVANAGITLSRAKDLTPEEATRQAVTILNDPRIPLDKKVEMADKFRNEYSTNRLNRQISANEKNNTELQTIYEQLSTTTPTTTKDVQTGVETITPKREDVSIDSYQNLTPEERTRYRADIQNQIERNNDEAKRLEDAAKKEKERVEKEQQALLEQYQKEVYSGTPPSQELTKQVQAISPDTYKTLNPVIRHMTQYRLASAEERTRFRNETAASIQSGSFKTDNERQEALLRLAAYDQLDSEMDKREAEAPVETYLERNPNTKLNPNDRRSTALALASTNSKIIPYSSKEIQDMKTQWSTPINKQVILQEFVNNTRNLTPAQADKALYDQISTVVDGDDNIRDHIVASKLLSQRAPSFEGNNVSGKSQDSLGNVIIRGKNSDFPVGKLFDELTNNQEYRNLGITSNTAKRMVISVYKALAEDSKVNVDTSGDNGLNNEGFNENVLKKAIASLYGEELESDWFGKGSFNTSEGTLVRLPVGMTQERAKAVMENHITNFSQLSGMSPRAIRSYNLSPYLDRPGVYVYTNAKGQPLAYGYTNKEGKGIISKPDKERNIPVPFIIDFNDHNK